MQSYSSLIGEMFQIGNDDIIKFRFEKTPKTTLFGGYRKIKEKDWCSACKISLHGRQSPTVLNDNASMIDWTPPQSQYLFDIPTHLMDPKSIFPPVWTR